MLKKIFTVFTFLITSCLQAQPGWIHQNIVETDSLRCVKFADPLTGWACGTNGTMIRTTNGGINWEVLNTDISNDLYSVFVYSGSLIFASGDSGIIIRSTNGGVNYTTLNTNTYSRLSSICFVNSQSGFVSGFNGIVLKTSDSGNNWIVLNSGTDIQLNSVFFTSQRNGWIAGYGGIFHTSDGGNNWLPQFIDGSLVLNSIFFVDSLHGWSAYYDNFTFGPEAVRTTDGGLDWRNFSMNESYSLSVYFINSSTGWSSGYYGKINYSTNAGTSWSVQSTGTIEHLYSVYFTDSLNGWAVGNSGTILKTTTGGVLTGFTHHSLHVPTEFNISQNYPNPFNPVTQLEIGIPELVFVSLKVYDLTGNVVATLVNEMKHPGNYSVKFDGTNLASGVYFYKIEAGNFNRTKRMILIK